MTQEQATISRYAKGRKMGKRFDAGEIIIAPRAAMALVRNNQYAYDLIWRHIQGDWGEVPVTYEEHNERVIAGRGEISSLYKLADGTFVWCITRFGHKVTELLLPDETGG